MSLCGLEGHKYSSHNFQLYFSSGMWGITLQSLICPFLRGLKDLSIVFLSLMTSFFCEMGDSSPPYSSFSPLLPGPSAHTSQDVSFIHLSPIQLVCTKNQRCTLNKTDSFSLMAPWAHSLMEGQKICTTYMNKWYAYEIDAMKCCPNPPSRQKSLSSCWEFCQNTALSPNLLGISLTEESCLPQG